MQQENSKDGQVLPEWICVTKILVFPANTGYQLQSDPKSLTSPSRNRPQVMDFYFHSRIRDLEAQISVLQDKVAVDEIKLNLVMSYENQILMNNHQSETVLELQKKMEDKDKEIRNLRKRLRIEEGFESEDRSKVSWAFSKFMP